MNNEFELWERLSSLKSRQITPHEDHGAFELMTRAVRDRTSLSRLVALCLDCVPVRRECAASAAKRS